MYFADNELAHRDADKVVYRPSPLRAAWVIEDLVTSDGHQVRCRFACSIGVLDSPTERKMLQEAFLGARPSLSVQDVVTHLAPAIRAAADKATYMRDAQTVLQDETQQAMCLSLRQVIEAVAFSCGLEVLAPFDLQVESPSYRRLQLERAQRVLIEQRLAGQTEHLARAAELLREFERVRQASPELTPGMVLGQLSVPDQGATLQMLLLAGSQQQSQPLLAVAGTGLLSVDLEDPDSEPALAPLPEDLGPLRSVRRISVEGTPCLLIGARDGVWVAEVGSVQAARGYRDADIRSAMGFSQSVLWHGQLWACHGEAGLVGWDLSAPERPVVAHRPEALGERMDLGGLVRPRNLLVLDEQRLLFSDGSRLCVLERDGGVGCWSSPTHSLILALRRDGDDLLSIHADGSICRRAVTNLGDARLQQYAAGLTAAGVLPWMGSMRLLLAQEEGPVSCVALDDPLVTQFASHHRGLRQIAGSARAVVGMTGDRQRLVIWNSWEGREPARELHLLPLTRHRLADIEL